MVVDCPQCKTTYDAAHPCPGCAGAVVLTTATRLVELGANSQRRPDKWQQSSGGRVITGTILAVGLCYGLLQLTSAAFRALNQFSPDGPLHPWIGLGLFQGMQALALLGGSIIAGVGQRRGAFFGAAVGICSGLLFIAGIFYGVALDLVLSFGQEFARLGSPIRNVTLYAMPILDALLGALGGWLGSLIWKPPPLDGIPYLPFGHGGGQGIQTPLTRKELLARTKHSYWEGTVAWPRVIVGVIVSVSGSIWAKVIIDFFLELSEGRMTIMTTIEDQMTFAEVFSLSIFLGGCVAGANTRNGLKQGTCVGILAASILAGFFMRGAFQQSVPGVYPVLSTLFLGPIGGWFGCELLPPLFRPRRGKARWWF